MNIYKIDKLNEVHVLGNSFVKYVEHLGSDSSIVAAARNSYNDTSKGEEKDKKLMRYLFKNKHTSPFEQVSITFLIRLPIFVMRQFVRHRTFRLNEVSARYSVLDMGYYVPERWREQDTKNKQGSVLSNDFSRRDFSDTLIVNSNQAFARYKSLLASGVAREMARMVLPVNFLTQIRVNIDISNLIKYFMLRDDNHAQWEHQEIARAMKDLTREHFPWVMGMYDEFMLEKSND